MKTILFFASDYSIGLSSLLADEAISLHRAGIPLLVICGDSEQEDGLFARLEEEGLPCAVIPALDAHANFATLRNQVCNCMQRCGAEVVHVQNNWQLALSVSSCLCTPKAQRPKIIYTIHGYRHNHFFKNIIARVVIGAALLMFADRVICMCSFLSRVFWPLKYKTELLPLGVSDVFFEDAALPSMAHVGLQIIYPAQFRKGKNQELVIRAFASYIQKTGDTKSHLVLPGSGPLYDEMSAYVASLGLEDRVSLPGLCSKRRVAELYASANVAVVASNRETYGQSIVEPFAMGRVLLSRPVGIATDIIDNGKNGYLFNDEQELSDLFCDIGSADEAAIQSISDRAKRDARCFKWDNVAKQYINMLKGV